MKQSFGKYQRIAYGALGCSSAWLGPDHLLYVKGNGFLFPFSEEYRRFRYRDIQSVVLATASSLWVGALLYSLCLALFAGLSFLLLYFREPGESFRMILTLVLPLPLAVLTLALLIRHLVLGPRCVFEIQTRITRERLRPITRLHQGKTALEPLAERIREAQADLPKPDGSHSDPAANSFPPAAPIHQATVPGLALPAFVIFGLAGILLLTSLHLSNPAFAGAFLILGAAGGAPLLIALTAGVRRRAPDSVLMTLWTLLVLALLAYGSGLVFFFAMALDDPGLTLGPTGPLEAFSQIEFLGGTAFYGIFLGLGALTAIVSVIGTGLCLRWRSLSKQPATAP